MCFKFERKCSPCIFFFDFRPPCIHADYWSATLLYLISQILDFILQTQQRGIRRNLFIKSNLVLSPSEFLFKKVYIIIKFKFLSSRAKTKSQIRAFLSKSAKYERLSFKVVKTAKTPVFTAGKLGSIGVCKNSYRTPRR